MNILFRTDASLEIGTGHVMRCLTLADALKKQGANCHFICREHEGDLIDFIRQQGHQVTTLLNDKNLTGQARSYSHHCTPGARHCGLDPQSPAVGAGLPSDQSSQLAHTHWLGTGQAEDAQQTIAALKKHQRHCGLDPQSAVGAGLPSDLIDWLVIDHYALDHTWQKLVAPYAKKILVIDDLGDRKHSANILLDQNYGATAEKYQNLVPENCQLLLGPEYALLRPEFAQHRQASLARRQEPQLKKLLINLGGVDKDNYAGQLLAEIRLASQANPKAYQLEITLVVGATSPWFTSLKKQAKQLSQPTQVLQGVTNMAELMLEHDLALGAAGSTIWERACLGLPSILLVIAENQQATAQQLEKIGAIQLATSPNQAIQKLAAATSWLKEVQIASQNLTQGLGVQKLANKLLKA